MAALASILNHRLAATQAQSSVSTNPVAAATGSTGSTSSTSSSSATISANDFLSLLVTEMQNQDPTASTDPNEYINQLVQVNSLEQLIDINQTISGALTPSSSGSTATTASGATANTAAAATAGAALQGGATGVQGATASTAGATVGTAPASSQSSQSALARLVPGNLDIPTSTAAAERIARSLDGRAQTALIR